MLTGRANARRDFRCVTHRIPIPTHMWTVSNGSKFPGRTVATGLTTQKTRPIGNRPVLPPKTRHFNSTTLPPINDLSSDPIMTWPVRRLCRSGCSFTARSQICDPTNIRWVAIENLLISHGNCHFFTATHPVSVGLQIGKRDVEARPELRNLRTDHVSIQWELKYFNGGKSVEMVKLEPRSGSNVAENQPGHSRSGFGPGLEPNQTQLLAGYPDQLLTLHMCTQWTHSNVRSQLATKPECIVQIRGLQGEKKG